MKRRRLCRLLDAAATELMPKEGSAWSDFDSGAEMAAFVLGCKAAIENETIDRGQTRKLWIMFAPTCDWDDVGGSQNLGNQVFGLVDTLYRREI